MSYHMTDVNFSTWAEGHGWLKVTDDGKYVEMWAVPNGAIVQVWKIASYDKGFRFIDEIATKTHNIS